MNNNNDNGKFIRHRTKEEKEAYEKERKAETKKLLAQYLTLIENDEYAFATENNNGITKARQDDNRCRKFIDEFCGVACNMYHLPLSPKQFAKNLVVEVIQYRKWFYAAHVTPTGEVFYKRTPYIDKNYELIKAYPNAKVLIVVGYSPTMDKKIYLKMGMVPLADNERLLIDVHFDEYADKKRDS
jgi:hypothetical protein